MSISAQNIEPTKKQTRKTKQRRKKGGGTHNEQRQTMKVYSTQKHIDSVLHARSNAVRPKPNQNTHCERTALALSEIAPKHAVSLFFPSSSICLNIITLLCKKTHIKIPVLRMFCMVHIYFCNVIFDFVFTLQVGLKLLQFRYCFSHLTRVNIKLCN